MADFIDGHIASLVRNLGTHEMKTLCNILESYDMTPEAVATKTMWLLGNRPDDHESREKAFYKPINYDTVWK